MGEFEMAVTATRTWTKARVILFKDSGKYYSEDYWEIPEGAIGPWDMERSEDFRRIGNGAVLIETQEPWGFPWLVNPA